MGFAPKWRFPIRQRERGNAVTEAILKRVGAGHDLSMEEMESTIDAIMHGDWSHAQIASLLMGLRAKGEKVAEIAGAAAAMRKNMTPIRTDRSGLIDTCGTGGDGSHTFNISTAAALVTAAAGVPVAKHGNRGVTSKSGSADALAELGVNIEASVEQVEACLAQLGICFCFAPLLHRSMKHVAPVRKELAVPTIFNLLGPLCNPASASHQLLGVGKPHLRHVMAEALAMLGTEHALVVCGEDGLDEITLNGTTHVTEVEDGQLREFIFTPVDFGLLSASKDALLVEGPQQSAAVIRDVLDGKEGSPRDIVVLNAAAALFTAGVDESTEVCARLAAEAVDNGAASDLLARLVEVSNA